LHKAAGKMVLWLSQSQPRKVSQKPIRSPKAIRQTDILAVVNVPLRHIHLILINNDWQNGKPFCVD
jgi:hypothetical protein